MTRVETGRRLKYTQALCPGCNKTIDCTQGYITLIIDDNTVQPADYKYSHFHNGHCLAQVIKHGEIYLRSHQHIDPSTRLDTNG